MPATPEDQGTAGDRALPPATVDAPAEPPPSSPVWAAQDNGAGLYPVARAAVQHSVDPDAEGWLEISLGTLPAGWSSAVAGGLASATALAAEWRPTDSWRRWVRRQTLVRKIPQEMLHDLGARGFRGALDGVADGEPVVPGCPLALVHGPLSVLALLEQPLRHAIAIETSAATWTARMGRAVGGRPVIATGPEGWPSVDLAARLARAAMAGGAVGSLSAEAGVRYGVAAWSPLPTCLLAEGSELLGGALLADLPPGELHGSIKVLAGLGQRLSTVRVTSRAHAAALPAIRRALDRSGLRLVRLMLDADLDEHELRALVGAPFDLLGIRSHRLLSAMAASCVVTRWHTRGTPPARPFRGPTEDVLTRGPPPDGSVALLHPWIHKGARQHPPEHRAAAQDGAGARLQQAGVGWPIREIPAG